jgi:hypothetical protein
LPTQNAASNALSEAFVYQGAGVQLRQHRRCRRRPARSLFMRCRDSRSTVAKCIKHRHATFTSDWPC